MGDDRVPGPSSYWIDAAVVLDAKALGGLPPVTALKPVSAPEVSSGVRAALPPGGWYTGAALDQALSGDGFSSTAYLAPDSSVLVLRAIGGN